MGNHSQKALRSLYCICGEKSQEALVVVVGVMKRAGTAAVLFAGSRDYSQTDTQEPSKKGTTNTEKYVNHPSRDLTLKPPAGRLPLVVINH